MKTNRKMIIRRSIKQTIEQLYLKKLNMFDSHNRDEEEIYNLTTLTEPIRVEHLSG
jgi:hypothetical protein